MSKDRQLLNRFGSNLAESMGAGRAARAGGTSPSPAPTTAAGPSRHDGTSRLRAGAEIEVGRIVADPSQPRTEFDPEAIGRLAASLTSHGQLQPITVRWDQDLGKYVVVTGERRWRAAIEAGRPTIACVILDGERNPSEILELQLIENALREDLKPVEQARAYRTLMDRNGWTALRLAEALHLNVASVSRALALLELPESVQEAVEQGTLPPSTAYEVSKLADPDAQRTLADRVVSAGLSRAEAAAEVRKAADRKRPSRSASKGRSTPKKTSTILRAGNGYRAMIDCRRGIEPAGLLEALEEWIAAIREGLRAEPDAGEGRAA